MADTVRYERDGHVATIIYDRPESLNAINGELRQDLNAAWERFREDEDAWVGIVTGAGRAFCVGADLKDGRGSVGEWPGTFWEIPTVNSFESGMEIWKPTIAAVPGYCLGYGLTAVLRCDFVIAADDAEFGFPEVRLGVPTIVGAMRLPGPGRMVQRDGAAADRRPGGAAAAKDMGLVWRVVPRDELMNAEARRWPTAWSPRHRSPSGPRRRWRRADRACRGRTRCGSANRCGGGRGATADASEGMAAAHEGRAPGWHGR